MTKENFFAQSYFTDHFAGIFLAWQFLSKKWIFLIFLGFDNLGFWNILFCYFFFAIFWLFFIWLRGHKNEAVARLQKILLFVSKTQNKFYL